MLLKFALFVGIVMFVWCSFSSVTSLTMSMASCNLAHTVLFIHCTYTSLFNVLCFNLPCSSLLPCLEFISFSIRTMVDRVVGSIEDRIVGVLGE